MMRRSEREIRDPEAIRAVIADCSCLRLGLYDDGEIYVVPVNFGYLEENGRDVFYFHGAAEGRKAALLRRSPRAGFEMDTDVRIAAAETACGCTAYYRSIIGTGTVTAVTDAAEKARGLQAIMAQATGRSDWKFPSLAQTCVWRLDADKLSCKANI